MSGRSRKTMLNKQENRKRIDQRIAGLDLEGKTVVAFDFDELVVPVHVSREVTDRLAKLINKEKLEALGENSFEGIEYLQSLAVGYEWSRYESLRDGLVRYTPWRKGFDELIQEVRKRFSMVFISSGMKDVCASKLSEIDFEKSNILGSEFQVEEGRIAGSGLIVTDRMKGYIVNRLRQNYAVVSVGHSLGDKYMLDNSDVSISFNPDVPGLTQYNAQTPEEILEIILGYKGS